MDDNDDEDSESEVCAQKICIDCGGFIFRPGPVRVDLPGLVHPTRASQMIFIECVGCGSHYTVSVMDGMWLGVAYALTESERKEGEPWPEDLFPKVCQ
jgi:hypothetical protein